MGVGLATLAFLLSPLAISYWLTGLWIFWLPAIGAIAYLYMLQNSDPRRNMRTSVRVETTEAGTLELKLIARGCEERTLLTAPLRMIKVVPMPKPLRSRIDFVVLPHKSHGIRKVSLRGSLQDIQWLHNRLARWKHIPLEKPGGLKLSTRCR